MAADPGLAADTCIYMEAVSGDNGAHDPNGTWWLSPDIQLVGSISGPDKADPGAANTINVTLHNRSTPCTLPPGTESVTIEIWVANPSLVMAPNNAASTTHIDSIGTPIFGLPPAHTQVFSWTPPAGLPASDPQSSGHKCLIARCYPDPLIPSTTSFFAPDDPHVAQHNICIVPCGGPGAARKPGPCGQEFTTINPDRKRAARARLRAVVDLEPSRFVRDVVMRRLKTIKGFAHLASKPPKHFVVQVRDDAKARVTPAKPARGTPSYEIDVTLEPGQLIHARLSADLSGGKLGDAYIFHLTQTDADRRPQGGLTVVMVSV